MKKQLIALIFTALIIFTLFGCNQTEGERHTSELPVLKIGCDEYEPYNFTDESGRRVGADASIAKEACRRMGYKPEFISIKWDEKDALLENGKIDCIWNCYSMNDREDKYLWAGPYILSNEAVIVLDASGYHTLKDLDGKNFAIQITTKPEQVLLSSEISPNPKKVYCFLEIEDALVALQQGYVEAVAGHKHSLISYSNSLYGKFRIIDEPLLKSKIGVAFSLTADKNLVDKLNGVLLEMNEDGTVAKYLKEYGIDSTYALKEGK